MKEGTAKIIEGGREKGEHGEENLRREGWRGAWRAAEARLLWRDCGDGSPRQIVGEEEVTPDNLC